MQPTLFSYCKRQRFLTSGTGAARLLGIAARRRCSSAARLRCYSAGPARYLLALASLGAPLASAQRSTSRWPPQVAPHDRPALASNLNIK